VSQAEALEDYARGRYFGWRTNHPAEAELLDDLPQDIPSRLWTDAWRAGSWDAIRRNAQLGLNLAQIIQRLEELAQLYGDVDMDRQFEHELERASAYWRGEVAQA